MESWMFTGNVHRSTVSLRIWYSPHQPTTSCRHSPTGFCISSSTFTIKNVDTWCCCVYSYILHHHPFRNLRSTGGDMLLHNMDQMWMKHWMLSALRRIWTESNHLRTAIRIKKESFSNLMLCAVWCPQRGNGDWQSVICADTMNSEMLSAQTRWTQRCYHASPWQLYCTTGLCKGHPTVHPANSMWKK